MSLEDRVLSGELERMRPSTGEISRLLEAARRRAETAANESCYPEIRLEQAYEAILNCALAALLASGLRPTNRPGKHVTVIASLRETLGVSAERVDYYQMLRTLRHRTLCEGTLDVAPSQAEQSASEARAFLAQTEKWMKARGA